MYFILNFIIDKLIKFKNIIPLICKTKILHYNDFRFKLLNLTNDFIF